MKADQKTTVRDRWVYTFPSESRCEMRFLSNNRLEFAWLRGPTTEEANSKPFRLLFRTWFSAIARDITNVHGLTVVTYHEPRQSRMILVDTKKPTAL